MKENNESNILCAEKKESYLCSICRHYDYCIIRKYGSVSYCEYFDFKKKEEKESRELENLHK